MTTEINMYSGDSKTLTIPITNNAGTAVNVATATSIKFAVFDRSGTQQFIKTLADGVAVSTSTVTVTLAPADTAALSGIYKHELEIVDSSGKVFTALQGLFLINPDYIT